MTESEIEQIALDILSNILGHIVIYGSGLAQIDTIKTMMVNLKSDYGLQERWTRTPVASRLDSREP